jgi:LPXTG-site transpeptidase (sortase) family protein
MRRFAAAVLVAACLLASLATPRAPASVRAAERGVPPVRIAIPAIGVDADIEWVAVEDGVMEAPSDPWSVGWYPHFGAPGGGGNVVMAGHVDWWGYGPTVFADLGLLGPGDEVVVTGEDGSEFDYVVSETWTVDANSSKDDVRRILYPDGGEALTLITCAGNFDGEGYDARLVVRARPVPSA